MAQTVPASIPVVLIPGYLLDADIWRDVTTRLSPERDVVVPDLAAFDTVEAMAEHLLATLPPAFTVAGLSLGGYVAMAMARRAPARIARMVLVNTKPTPDPAAARERRMQLRALAEGGRLAEAQRALEPLMLTDCHRIEGAQALTRLRAMYSRSDATRFVRHQNALNTRPDHSEALGAVTMPTLVVASRKDALIPFDVTLEMIRRLPNARVVLLEDTGHLSLLERPLETAEILSRFLAGSAA